jgi:hypothetical protein
MIFASDSYIIASPDREPAGQPLSVRVRGNIFAFKIGNLPRRNRIFLLGQVENRRRSPIKVWSGSSWILTKARSWDGNRWKNIVLKKRYEDSWTEPTEIS